MAPADCEERTAANPYSAYDLNKAITEYFEEALPKAGFKLSMFLSNVRLILMASACIGGLYSHFGCKFPRDHLWIGFFSLAYFLQSGIVSLIDYFLIKKSCAVFDDKVTGERVYLDVETPLQDSDLTMRLRSKKLTVSSAQPVGKYFYKDGRLDQKIIFADFASLYDQFKAQSKGKKE